MTDEQFERAVKISIRIKELEEVKKEISETEEHRLSYSYYSSAWQLCPLWVMSQIRGILDKHDKMIRQEIDEEISTLKEEIKEL